MNTVSDTAGLTAGLHDAETSLQRAQRHSDVDALDELVHPDATFVGPDGSVLGKDADLDAHRSGQLRLHEVTEHSRTVRLLDSATGTSCVRLHLRGTAGGDALEADVVYTRTWVVSDDGWRVIQAQGCIATATRH